MGQKLCDNMPMIYLFISVINHFIYLFISVINHFIFLCS